MKKLEEQLEPVEETINTMHTAWKGQSYLGRIGKTLEPVVEPLGWDWRIGMAAPASFPAREVMVMTLGIIFGQGDIPPDENEVPNPLHVALADAHWPGQTERPLFSVPVALSVMVFFAL